MKIYFASDQHFGAPDFRTSKERELVFIQWLDTIKIDATELFLLGDLFDFWFEYKTVVPKGFIRVLGKLTELQASGIKIHFFTGNHDIWMRDYFEKELHISVYRKPKEFSFINRLFLIGHGDGLGPGDTGYKLMKGIFHNPVLQWFYRWLHPDIGLTIGRYLSLKNKYISGKEDVEDKGEKEMLLQYCYNRNKEKKYDFFVFGHRHLPIKKVIGEHSIYVNTGDWVRYNSYAVFDGDSLQLKYFKKD